MTRTGTLLLLSLCHHAALSLSPVIPRGGRMSARRALSTRAAVDPESFSVAPMMDYTDRHLRFLLRLLSRRAVLYTEMIAASTLVHNEDTARWLAFNDPVEHPVVLQLGGSDPADMGVAARKAAAFGYDAVNLNCGCPSDKVAGNDCFGAALMREPQRVSELCNAISAHTGRPATVKCRIGVDDDESFEQLCDFVRTIADGASVEHFVVHARKAILSGLTPEQNRNIPPLKYDFVYDLLSEFPALKFTLNGGVLTPEDCEEHLARGVHGVMVGRSVINQPWTWATVDTRLFGEAADPAASRRAVMLEYVEYAEAQVAWMQTKNPKYAPKLRRYIMRHVANLFHGEPNGKRFRAALDRALLNKSLPLRDVLAEAMAVLADDVLNRGPGLPRMAPSELAANDAAGSARALASASSSP